MIKPILFIGLDVDDKAFHGVGLSAEGVETEFKIKPTIGALTQKLEALKRYGDLKICYEATYVGFSLCREIRKRGFDCEVIAPSLVPRKPGQQVKTDRIDARKLAKYFMNKDLVVVHVPDVEDENVRDLVRSRGFLKDQSKRLKLHILSLCRRMGLRYREAGAVTSYWRQAHFQWLENQAKTESFSKAFKFNLMKLIDQLKTLENEISFYDEEIENISKSEKYKKKVEALCCYRGIDTLTAMVCITEIVDISRFDHPRRMTSFCGMDLIEDSSGGKEKRFHMTKMGNSYLRKAIIESCQTVFQIPRVSKRLKSQRQNIDEKFIDIADRCMKRLHKKSTRLLYGGKVKNKIKVACARELLGFMWESLRAAA